MLGLSRWATPFQIWARKAGLPAGEDDGAQRVGRYMERGVLAWLRDEVAAERLVEAGGYDTPWVAHPSQWPHVGCHPDGYLQLAGTGWRGAEAKTSSDDPSAWGEDPGEVPVEYWLQCQVGMALTGFSGWWLAVLFPIQRRFALYLIEPDPETVAEALQRCEAWWARHVVADQPPALDDSEDARRWLLSRHPEARGPLRAATAAEAALVREVAALRHQQRRLQAVEREASARLCALIGDAEGLEGYDTRATWRAQTTRRIDLDRLRAEAPEATRLCEVTSRIRVLRVDHQSQEEPTP